VPHARIVEEDGGYWLEVDAMGDRVQVGRARRPVVAEQILWSGASGRSVDTVRVALERIAPTTRHGIVRRLRNGLRRCGFKSCPEDRRAATVVTIDLLLEGIAGARNRRYLRLWSVAA
jgi:hypothetical protein